MCRGYGVKVDWKGFWIDMAKIWGTAIALVGGVAVLFLVADWIVG